MYSVVAVVCTLYRGSVYLEVAVVCTLYRGSVYLEVAVVWDKQWKSRRGCLEKFALGRSRGISDFPEGHSPQGPEGPPLGKYPDNP